MKPSTLLAAAAAPPPKPLAPALIAAAQRYAEYFGS